MESKPVNKSNIMKIIYELGDLMWTATGEKEPVKIKIKDLWTEIKNEIERDPPSSFVIIQIETMQRETNKFKEGHKIGYIEGWEECKELVIDILHEVGVGLDDPDYDFVVKIMEYVKKLKAGNTQKYKDFLRLQEAVITFKKEVNSIFSGHTAETIEKLNPYDFMLKNHLDRLNAEEDAEEYQIETHEDSDLFNSDYVIF